MIRISFMAPSSSLVQDVRFSACKHRFKSGWGYQSGTYREPPRLRGFLCLGRKHTRLSDKAGVLFGTGSLSMK